MEMYSSDNITVLRSRVKIDTDIAQYCLNITNDFGHVPVGNPIVIQDCYINGGISPVLTRPRGGTKKKNARYVGNYFGDSMTVVDESQTAEYSYHIYKIAL